MICPAPHTIYAAIYVMLYAVWKYNATYAEAWRCCLDVGNAIPIHNEIMDSFLLRILANFLSCLAASSSESSPQFLRDFSQLTYLNLVTK